MSDYETNLKSWGSIGEVYPDNYNYIEGEAPVEEWDNFLTNNIIEDIDHLISLTNRRVETDSGPASSFPSDPDEDHLYVDTDDYNLHVYHATENSWSTLNTSSEFSSHTNDTNNPHDVTLEQARSVSEEVAGNIRMGGNALLGVDLVGGDNDNYSINFGTTSASITVDDGSGGSIDSLIVNEGGNVEVPSGDILASNITGSSGRVSLGTSYNRLLLDGGRWSIENEGGSTVADFYESGDVEIPNGDLDLTGNSVKNISAFEGSDNVVGTSELDLSITPTWTGEHTFDDGVVISDGSSVDIAFREGGWSTVSETSATVQQNSDRLTFYLDDTGEYGDGFGIRSHNDGDDARDTFIVNGDGDVEIPNGDLDLGSDEIVNLNNIRASSSRSHLRFISSESTDTFRFEDESESPILEIDPSTGNTSVDGELEVGGDVDIPNGDLNVDGSVELNPFSVYPDGDDLVISDGDVDLIRQPKAGPTQFIQGAEIGTIESPEDSYTQLINTSSTADATSGDTVGYTLALNNESMLSVSGEATGDGGVTATELAVQNADLLERGDRVATRTWTDSNFNDYTFSESYNDLTNRGHGNEDHDSSYVDDDGARDAVDGASLSSLSLDQLNSADLTEGQEGDALTLTDNPPELALGTAGAEILTQDDEPDVTGEGEAIWAKTVPDALTATGAEQKWQDNPHWDTPNAVYASDGVVYSGGRDDRVIATDAEDESQIWSHGLHNSSVQSVHESDGVLYSGALDDLVIAVDAADGTEMWQHDLHTGSVLSVFESDGVVYSASTDNTVIAADAIDGTEIWQHELHTDRVRSVSASDGVVYSASRDDTVIAADAADGTERWQHELHTDVVEAVYASDRVVYSGGDDDTVIAAKASDGSEIWEHDLHTNDVNQIYVSGGVVYSASNDGTVLAVDAEDGTELWQEDFFTEGDYNSAYSVHESDGVVYTAEWDVITAARLVGTSPLYYQTHISDGNEWLPVRE